MSKVLITGASGFVGKNLINFLLERQVDAVPFSRTNGQDY
ncbi:NAD-dependent epimerase/dehydratase family protein, partial [Vibrio parahaemolyticus]